MIITLSLTSTLEQRAERLFSTKGIDTVVVF